MQGEIAINAPAPAVYKALLQFDRFAELSDVYTESRYLEPAADGTPRVYTRIDGCIAFFCKTIERTAQLQTELGVNVTSIAEPGLSDAKTSVESWTVKPNGNASIIVYDHRMETKFWVPPLIGTAAIKGAVKGSAKRAGRIIETLALEGADATTANL